MTEPDDPVAAVRRWETTGGVWRVLADHDGALTVGLFQCDGGELAQQVTSAEPALRALVAGRSSSEE